MTVDTILKNSAILPGNLPTHYLRVNREQWLQTAADMRKENATLLSLWGADDRDRDGGFRIFAAYLLPRVVLVVEYFLTDTVAPSYSSIASFFPVAARMQRAVHDLLGISTEAPDTRGWLRHGGWPETTFPLRKDFDGDQQYPVAAAPYSFVSVEGDGVHEIAVGPVHAGTIEPGHFRFSVVGEKVLRLEERLGYTHKGVAKLFEKTLQRDGHRLAARLSGDSAVAFSWAYCVSLESITGTVCPNRALWLRALALEQERIANHLGDLGALGNDAGFAFSLTQFSKLKEDLLRVNATAFGARYLMDYVVPGGVALDLTTEARGALLTFYDALEPSVIRMHSIFEEHAGVQDRFREAGRLEKETAEQLGAIGLVARASGIACDLRAHPCSKPYDALTPKISIQTEGDVAARAQIRFEEVLESLRLCRKILADIAAGAVHATVPVAKENQIGIGLIEGWRGPVMIALETGPDESIRRCHAHDPSWQNWPLLEYAILGNIVPDFPLINKSFNLSYSGQDG